MSYFILSSTIDSGITIDGPLDKAGVSEWIKDRTDGVSPEHHPVFVDKVPDHSEGHFFLGKGDKETVVIIEGDIQVPMPVRTVTEWVL